MNNGFVIQELDHDFIVFHDFSVLDFFNLIDQKLRF